MVGKRLQRVTGCCLHAHHRHSGIVDELLQDFFLVIILLVFVFGKRAHPDDVAIFADHGNCLADMLRLIAIHDNPQFGFQLPATFVNIEDNDIHPQVKPGLLGTQAGTQARVEEDQQQGFVLAQRLIFIRILFQLEGQFQRFIQTVKVVYRCKMFHDG